MTRVASGSRLTLGNVRRVTALGNDLRTFLDTSPSPYHAVAEATRRLDEAGFTPLDERERWALTPGEQRYVVRDGGSLIAFRVGTAPLADAGVRLVGTHTEDWLRDLRAAMEAVHEVRRAGPDAAAG